MSHVAWVLFIWIRLYFKVSGVRLSVGDPNLTALPHVTMDMDLRPVFHYWRKIDPNFVDLIKRVRKFYHENERVSVKSHIVQCIFFILGKSLSVYYRYTDIRPGVKQFINIKNKIFRLSWGQHSWFLNIWTIAVCHHIHAKMAFWSLSECFSSDFIPVFVDYFICLVACW